MDADTLSGYREPRAASQESRQSRFHIYSNPQRPRSGRSRELLGATRRRSHSPNRQFITRTGNALTTPYRGRARSPAHNGRSFVNSPRREGKVRERSLTPTNQRKRPRCSPDATRRRRSRSPSYQHSHVRSPLYKRARTARFPDEAATLGQRSHFFQPKSSRSRPSYPARLNPRGGYTSRLSPRPPAHTHMSADDEPSLIRELELRFPCRMGDVFPGIPGVQGSSETRILAILNLPYYYALVDVLRLLHPIAVAHPELSRIENVTRSVERARPVFWIAMRTIAGAASLKQKLSQHITEENISLNVAYVTGEDFSRRCSIFRASWSYKSGINMDNTGTGVWDSLCVPTNLSRPPHLLSTNLLAGSNFFGTQNIETK